MNLVSLLSEAFSERRRPSSVVVKDHPATHEYAEATIFEGVDWRATSCEQWDKNSDSIYGFSPEAFCYFLPGILTAQFKDDRPDLLVNSTLINMLDRSQNVENWDTFFAQRWPLLSKLECEAVQQWLLWLSSKDTGMLSEAALTRAYETLDTLANRAT